MRASVMRSTSSPDIREQAVFVIDSIPIRPRPYRTQATCWTLGLLVSLVISKTTHATQKANRKIYINSPRLVTAGDFVQIRRLHLRVCA